MGPRFSGPAGDGGATSFKNSRNPKPLMRNRSHRTGCELDARHRGATVLGGQARFDGSAGTSFVMPERRLGRRRQRELAVDDRVALLTLAVLVHHAVDVSLATVGARHLPGLGQIGRIGDGHAILE